MRRACFGVAIILLMGALGGCISVAPPLGRGLPREFAKAKPLFQQRVSERFPVGSSEAALVDELRRERFRIVPLHRQFDGLQFSGGRLQAIGLLCNAEWTVMWGASDGRITQIRAVYDSVCD